MWDGDPSREERNSPLRGLARPYFVPVCISVLDPYLVSAGFRRTRQTGDKVMYRRGTCILEFGYAPYLTDYQPKYSLTAGIGVRTGWFFKPRIIGLWQVPNPDRGGNRWAWEFSGPEQLKAVLKKVVALLESYARPLWEDEARLRAVVDREWPIYQELANP